MIRYTEPADGPFLHDIDIKSYDHHVWNTRQFLTNDTYVYVADGRPVAFISWNNKEGELLILKLAVTPSFRRQGIGTTLINSVLSRQMVTACVIFEEDLGGQLMLKKNGFLYTKTVHKDGHTLYLMENKNGINNLAGSSPDRCFPLDDPEMGRHGDIGEEVTGFESPADYP